MSPEYISTETRFIADRMLGTLTRYLRFMGYDTISANGFGLGCSDEDTRLLILARNERRILLTRDHELARRGTDCTILVVPGDVLIQVQQLVDLGLIQRRLSLGRCSLCNTLLREATDNEAQSAHYAPHNRVDYKFFWCDTCKKLYWNGSHGKHLHKRLSSDT